MNVDVNYIGKEAVNVKYDFDVFKTEEDYKTGLFIMFTFCGDFDLMPEIEVSDFKEIVERGIEQSKKSMTVQVDEEGIEILLED